MRGALKGCTVRSITTLMARLGSFCVLHFERALLKMFDSYSVSDVFSRGWRLAVLGIQLEVYHNVAHSVKFER